MLATRSSRSRSQVLSQQKRGAQTSAVAAPFEDSSSPVSIIDMALSEEEIGDSIHHACTTSGFFIIVNHGVSEELCTNIMQQARSLFSLSEKDKQAISVEHSDSYRGFQNMGVNVTNGELDGHEALDLISESKRAIIPNRSITNYGQNLWPSSLLLPDFRPTTEKYVEAMNQVGLRLMNACSRGLGLDPSFFEPYFDDAYWSMRMIRYPGVEDASNDKDYQFGVGEHTDYGVFTMILADSVKGTLQIRPRNTSEWIDVDPIPNGFVCNLGDMLARWSNNVYVSTPHRVMQPLKSNCGESGDRISIPFFFDPNYDSIIRPIDELVNKSENRVMFEPIMYGDHYLGKTSKNFKV
ncbi:MAG: hypothetical protein SGILL_008063 [Bacillariaceae sp.]